VVGGRAAGAGADGQRLGNCVSQSITMFLTEEEERWRRWVDARLVRVLTVNIYRNRAESFQTFDYITQQGNFNWLEKEAGRFIGAATMWWGFPLSGFQERSLMSSQSGCIRRRGASSALPPCDAVSVQFGALQVCYLCGLAPAVQGLPVCWKQCLGVPLPCTMQATL